MAHVVELLRGIPGTRHVVQIRDAGPGGALVSAELVDDAVDAALDYVRRLGVAAEDVVLVRLDSIGPSVAARPLCERRVGGPAQPGRPECPAVRTLPGVHGRCRDHRGLRRHLRERDAGRGRDGDQP
jgi:hypothetical protein